MTETKAGTVLQAAGECPPQKPESINRNGRWIGKDFLAENGTESVLQQSETALSWMDFDEDSGLYWAVMRDLDDAVKHGVLVSNLASHLARKLGCPESFCAEMAVAGMVHDIGKLRLSEYLYGRKEGTLRVEEMTYMRMHTQLGREILAATGDYPDTILEIVYHHHENDDGSGYPNNKKGKEIPYGARILRVCDVFAALVSNRPYRAGFDKDTAIRMMIEEVKHFDMKIFLTFLEMAYEERFAEIEERIREVNG